MTRKIPIRWLSVAVPAALAAGAAPAWGEPAPRQTTREFLGDEAAWAEAAMVVQQASPLFGAREYYLSGAGDIVVVDVRLDEEVAGLETRFVFTGLKDQVDAIFEKLCNADALNAPAEQADGPAPTCIGPPLLILRSSDGQVRSMPFPRAEAYEDAWLAVSALKHLIRNAEPVHEGAYQADYIPNGFDWSANLVTPRKQIRWDVKPTAEEQARAEAEYERKAQIQLQAVEQRRQEELRAGAATQGPVPSPQPTPETEERHDSSNR